MFFFHVLPEFIIPTITKTLSFIVYYTFAYRKKVIIKNLNLAFPNLSKKELKSLIKQNYNHLLLFIFELILLFKWKNKKVLKVTQFSLKDELNILNKNGGILLSGHLGNWEVFMRAMCINKFPIYAIMQKQKNRKINQLIEDWRNNVGMKVIYTGGALRKSLDALLNGGIVGIMGDQDARKRGIFSPFFGKMSSTHVGAAIMSYKYEKNVVVTFGIRDKFKHYHMESTTIDVKKIKESCGSKEEFIQIFIDRYNLILEEAIRKHPDQYFWFHKRWKTPFNGKKIVDYEK